ncbi:hypothetical protein [Acidianus sp. HS-5]|uniref:hypothetical protein n=1 Tax=Acidianus sp. HS-5 TaxID=2886040 RepID=UPI001F1B79D1|nr:hypothetical protein [Acidianus sp. HS-5]BDC17491.1 hypothetical protein HS5_03810 [Acidianus sp. HS-5]
MQSKVLPIVGLIVAIVVIAVAVVLLLPHGSSSSYSPISSQQTKITQVGDAKIYYYSPEYYQFGIGLNSSSAVKVTSAYVEINGQKLENDSVNIMLSPGTNFLVIYIPSNSSVLSGLSEIPITLCLNDGQKVTLYGKLCGCYICNHVYGVGEGALVKLNNGTWELYAKISSNINVDLIAVEFGNTEIPAEVQLHPGVNSISVNLGNICVVAGQSYNLDLVLNNGQVVTITAEGE